MKALYWSYTIGATCIEFDSVPFSVGEKRTLDCQHGDEYFKPKKALGKRVRLQGSRKMGCKAHITLHQYVLYPDYILYPSVVHLRAKTRRG